MDEQQEEPQVPGSFRVTVRAVVRRTDGTVEDLGIISDSGVVGK